MHFPSILFWLVFAGMLLYFGFNIIRRGGLKGAFFDATITRTVGVVEAAGVKLVTQRIKVRTLGRNNESLIGIEVVSKAIGSYELRPVALSKDQAQRLVTLLRERCCRNRAHAAEAAAR